MYLLFLAFQTEVLQSELEFFDKLLESSPFRLLIALLGLAMLAMIGMALIFVRTVSRLSVNSQSAQNTQEDKKLELLNTSLNRNAEANDRLGDRQEAAIDKLVAALTSQYEQMGEDTIYINESLTRIVDVVAQSAVNTAKNTEAVATIVVEAAAMHERTRLFFTEQMKLAVRQYEQHQLQDKALSIMSADFQFPEDNDPRWIIARVRSKTSRLKATVWAIPKFRDDKTFVGEIENGTGELVYVIQYTAWRGWHAVRKISQPTVRGWIDADLVEVIIPVNPIPSKDTSPSATAE